MTRRKKTRPVATVEESQHSHERVLQESQARAERLALLNHIAHSASTTLDLDEVLEVIYREVSGVLRADAFFIALYTPSTQEMDWRIGIDKGERLARAREPLGAGFSAQVVAERRSLLIRNYAQERAQLPKLVLWGSMNAPDSWLGVPLMLEEEVAGIISVQAYEPNVYTAADQELLETIADSVAMALEHARLYASLQEANGLLEAAIQAKDEMIQNVSHELRTPLTTIKGYSEGLNEGLFGTVNEEQRQAIDLISTRAMDLTRLVNGLLTLQTFTTDSLRPVPVTARPLLEYVAENWQSLSSTKVKIAVEVSAPDPVVYADRDYLREVLDQLMNNALKFTPAGGQICLSAEQHNGHVRLAVSDTGIGIPPNKLDLIFERFYQVDGTSKRTYGGAGIGLAVAAQNN